MNDPLQSIAPNELLVCQGKYACHRWWRSIGTVIVICTRCGVRGEDR